VTVNHRLGPFGYLDLRDINPELAHSSIAGILDVVLSLQWVHDNIDAFGGNPDNVMLFGHSSGAHEVCTLMGMSIADGLFHKAATLTGFGVRVAEPDHTLAMTKKLVDHLGVDAADIGALEAVDARTLAGAPPRVGIQLRPALDDTYLARHPFDPDAPGSAADKPMLIGTTWDEMSFLATGDPAYPDIDDTELQRRLEAQHGDKAARIIDLYHAEHPELSAPRIYARAMSEGYRRGAYDLATRKLAGGTAPVFMYLFTYQSDALDGLLGATHGVEIPFIFDTIDASGLTGTRPDRQIVADRTSELFTTFARTGTPAAIRAPTWPAWTPNERATMLIDTRCHIENDPCGDEVRLVTG
jgi:para-nitrobenzyl esterase